MDIKHKIQFGCNADELAMKVLSGKKTATSSLYDYHYNEYKDIIKVNEFASILDSHNKEICIIQITKIEIVKFESITEKFSIEEGDVSLENWKRILFFYIKENWVKTHRRNKVALWMVYCCCTQDTRINYFLTEI